MSNEIQEYILKYYNYVLSNTKTQFISETTSPSQSDYVKFSDNKFIHHDIQESIIRNYRHIKVVYYTCQSPLSTKVYQIQMIYYLPHRKMTHWNDDVLNLFEHYLKSLFILFFYLEHTHSQSLRHLSKPIQIHYCPTEFPKRIMRATCQTKPFIFRPDNVNSGYTVFDSTGESYIVIYRYEEFNRLLFHECIHYLGIDGEESKWTDFVDVGEEVQKNLNVVGRIHLYESYTDLWAIYWNIYIHIYFNPKANFDTLWKDEIDHQVKLIEHSMYCIGNKSIREWTNRDTNSPSWNMEDTPSFDYYVLKHGAFQKGIDEVNRLFPFGKTTWNKSTVRKWVQFCQQGLVPYYDSYSPKNHEKDRYVSTVMSNIGLKL
jgi:hypothetical protein